MAKILLVDGEKEVRDFTARFFFDRNFEVISAASGSEAIASVRRDCPDIILLEIEMRDMDGIEALKRIMKISRAARVIIVSSVNNIEIKDKAKLLGAADYLTKPVVLGELINVVLANLGKQKRFFSLKKA